jgi:SAM-dependent methyltransferase
VRHAGFGRPLEEFMFFFLPDPASVLAESARVLRPGGRVAVFATSKELRGTPAAPEPMATRSRFYEDAELEQLARDARFAEASVTRPGSGAQLLVAGRARDGVKPGSRW